ncbi:hypothetical protein VSDG_02197 [Cytospora chrysosperma]|uniref:Uncharacterized protein n=1 Tax=Cytospora chrysosperma TaxID=252740 RepID=A0A423WE96_CYTCH|nr:hypothetical protein VSDG_02197 [Valsa sordida]
MTEALIPRTHLRVTAAQALRVPISFGTLDSQLQLLGTTPTCRHWSAVYPGPILSVHDAQGMDLDGLGSSLPPSRGGGSVQATSDSPGNGGGQAGQPPPPLNTSVSSFSTDNTEDFNVGICAKRREE